MSTLATTDAAGRTPAGPRPAARPASWPGKVLLLSACAAVAAAPFAYAHFVQISLRPHYQFFPLAVLAAGVVAAVRFRGFRPAEVGDARATGVTVGAALLGLAAAAVLGSSWLGYLSLLIAAAGLTYGAAGRAGLARAAPALALLALILPPPFDLDRDLVFALRRLTTSLSGSILDAVRVPHLMAGNVVELGHRRLMVEDACSGINSLFGLLATALFLAALFGRSLAHTVLLVAATVGWVIVTNVVRVAAVVAAAGRGIDLTAGWRHEAISIGLFVAAVLLTASTDCLLRLLAERVADWRAGRAGSDVVVGTLVPAAKPADRRAGFCWSWPATAATAVAFLAVAAASWGLNGPPAGAGQSAAVVARLDRLPETLLPERVDTWRRADFRSERRERGDAFGEFSKTWTYRGDGPAAVVAVDYPFGGWHDLTWCYTSQGWVVRQQRVVPAADGRPECVEVAFERAGFRAGYLLYAEFDAAGRPLQARLGGSGQSLHRHQRAVALARYRLGLGPAPPPDEPETGVGQLQLWIASETPLSAERRSAAQTLFAAAYAAIRQELDAAK